jgi:hypothetical protein
MLPPSNPDANSQHFSSTTESASQHLRSLAARVLLQGDFAAYHPWFQKRSPCTMSPIKSLEAKWSVFWSWQHVSRFSYCCLILDIIASDLFTTESYTRILRDLHVFHIHRFILTLPHICGSPHFSLHIRTTARSATSTRRSVVSTARAACPLLQTALLSNNTS